MKNIFVKSLVFIVIFSLMVSACAFGAQDTEKLYEKYRYDEDFVYKDEFIAHALKSSVVLIQLNYKATIEYKPVTFSIEAVIEHINDLYEKYDGEYSKAEVTDYVLEEMPNDITSYLEWGDLVVSEVDATMQGSGVIIDEFGYIATNSHVAHLDKNDKIEACMNQLQVSVASDLKTVIAELAEIGVTLSEEQAKELYDLIIEKTVEQAEVDNESSSIWVYFPSASGDTSQDSKRAFEAEIVARGVSGSESTLGVTMDCAILEIKKEGLVSLKLSDSYPEVNSKIVSAGFPVAADTAFRMNGSNKSVLSVTIGTGNISRHIAVEDADYKAIEISTTISGGNSGGPSVNEKLRIEGLNTYTSMQDVRYAYMIPAEYVSELSSDFEVGLGEVSVTFLTGLQMLQQDYGAAALECFEKVQSLNPDVPYIENLIDSAKKAPQEYPAYSQKWFLNLDLKLIALIGGGVALVIIIVVTAVVISKKSKRKKRKSPYGNPSIFESYDINNTNSQSNNNQFNSANGTQNQDSAPTQQSNMYNGTRQVNSQNMPSANNASQNFNFNQENTSNYNQDHNEAPGKFVGQMTFEKSDSDSSDNNLN